MNATQLCYRFRIFPPVRTFISAQGLHVYGTSILHNSRKSPAKPSLLLINIGETFRKINIPGASETPSIVNFIALCAHNFAMTTF